MVKPLRVGIAGFGTVGRVVGKALDRGIPGLELTAVVTGHKQNAEARLQKFRRVVPVVTMGELPALADIIVECAPTEAFPGIAEPVLKAGNTLVTISGAAILQHPEIIDLAQEFGGQIILATGALLGLDAVRAASEGVINSVKMITRKPPKALVNARYIINNGINIENLDEPVMVFSGNARTGAENFPANVNVAAALGLAGIGPDRTHLEIWADPGKTRNTHHISVDADSASFEMYIENVPTEENPGTGRLTALSLIAALRAMHAPLRVGT